jgi:hypothetical protein
MTLPAPFSLLKSAYNDFLFAPIGEEENGSTLSVLSALTRLELDPWEVAARLAGQSERSSRDALSRLIERISGPRRSPAEAKAIAARLIGLLPKQDPAAPINAVAAAVRSRGVSPRLLWVIAAVLLLLLVQHLLF